MEKFINAFLIAVLMLSLTGCEKNDESAMNYVDVSLPKDCTIPIDENTPFVVGSMAEFRQLCPDMDLQQNIDFNIYNLVLVKGVSNYGIHQMTDDVIISGNSCVIRIKLEQNVATVVETWYYAVLLSKDIDDIALDIIYSLNRS